MEDKSYWDNIVECCIQAGYNQAKAEEVATKAAIAAKQWYPVIQGYTFSFGEAIERLKAGKRVARHGWNGKGMFLWLLPAGRVPKTAIHDPALRAVIDQHVEGDAFEALPSIRMWTRNSEGRWAVLTGWLASQTDMLSEDWYEVN